MKSVGIIGYPLGHSISPQIHNFIYQKLSIEAFYKKWEFEEINMSSELNKINDSNFIGANVTVPYKEKIISFLDEIESEAKHIGAVNTIVKCQNQLIGHNTDVYGIEKCLHTIFQSENIKNVVIVGSGGAAKAALYVLLNRGLKNLSLINRTPLNAKNMLARFDTYNFDSKILTFDQKTEIQNDCLNSDLIINSTTIGMKGTDLESESPLETICFNGNSVVFDMVYNPRITKLIANSLTKNATIIEGIDMLVYQAIKSIELWTGQIPSFDLMKKKCLELL